MKTKKKMMMVVMMKVVVVVMSFLVSSLGPGIRGMESYPCMCIGAEELTLMSPDRECALTVNRIGSREAAFRIKM